MDSSTAAPAPARFTAALRAVLTRELLIELRHPEGLVKTLLLALAVLVIFQFGLATAGRGFAQAGPAMIFTAVFFSGAAFVLGNFEREESLGQMPVFAMMSCDRGALFLGKGLALAGLLTLTGALTLLGGAFFFDGRLDATQWLGSLALVAAGSIGFAGLGLILSFAAREGRGGGAVAAILLPLLMPLFIALTQAEKILLNDGTLASAKLWLGVILIFDVLFALAPALIFDALCTD
jgi:ABC-type transport system involved in cytochrome c biogenesis permease component